MSIRVRFKSPGKEKAVIVTDHNNGDSKITFEKLGEKEKKREFETGFGGKKGWISVEASEYGNNKYGNAKTFEPLAGDLIEINDSFVSAEK